MGVTAATALLPQALAQLKRDGSSLLVVGDRPAQSVAYDRLTGDPTVERHHLDVSPVDGVVGCDDEPASARTVAVDTATLADGDVESGATAAPTTRLSRLAAATVDQIDAVADAGLGPAQLRVCIGPLAPLVEVLDHERVCIFLDAVLDRVQVARGMAHVHCRGDLGSDLVRRLEPRFDAVVEVRTDPAPAQRWHLSARDLTTDWIPLRD